MKDESIKALDNFVRVFGEDYGTAQVLTRPSENDMRVALSVVDDVPLPPIIRDLAIICAREVANVFEQSGLRAADYADNPDLPAKVAAIVKKALSSGKGRELFETKFREYLRMRG